MNDRSREKSPIVLITMISTLAVLALLGLGLVLFYVWAGTVSSVVSTDSQATQIALTPGSPAPRRARFAAAIVLTPTPLVPTLTPQSATATICGVATPSPSPLAAMVSPQPRVLGTTLGTIALHMPSTMVSQRLGSPTEQTITHGLGSPKWIYAGGLAVELNDATTLVDSTVVWRIRAALPFTGTTAEGFHLGETAAQFRHLYSGFAIQSFSDPLTVSTSQAQQLQIGDGRDITLVVQFDSSNIAQWLILEDGRCFNCVPLIGSPGTGKGP